MTLLKEETGKRKLGIRQRYLGVCIRRIDICSLAHVEPLLHLLATKQALPHIEALDWNIPLLITSRSVLEIIASSPVKHIKVPDLSITSDVLAVTAQGSSSLSFPLQTLFLQNFINWHEHEEEMTRQILIPNFDLARLCASTVETLGLCAFQYHYRDIESGCWMVRSEKDQVPQESYPDFPRLRNLHVSICSCPPSLLKPLFNASLTFLFLSIHECSLARRFFKCYGRIPTLHTFAFVTNSLDEKFLDCILPFLKANSQLEKVCSSTRLPPQFLEGKLLPLLATSMPSLTSLIILWRADSIEESGLKLLGSLKGLKYLTFGCYKYRWRKSMWLINHEITRKHLRDLSNLKALHLQGDTYRSNPASILFEDIEDYYENQYLEFDWPGRSRPRRLNDVWMDYHINMVFNQGYKYHENMPNLEMLAIGRVILTMPQQGKPELGRLYPFEGLHRKLLERQYYPRNAVFY